MSAVSSNSPLLTPNPFAVQAIIRSGGQRNIVTVRDIVDQQGIKLWARDQPVAPALQQKLLDRKLREPLETCLRAVDGVSCGTLAEATLGFMASGHPLAASVQPYVHHLETEVRRLSMQPAVELLLTAAKDSDAGMFDHAVCAMLVCGALAAWQQATPQTLRLALLAGLVHDLGEMYIPPTLRQADLVVDAASFRHIAVHPRVGRLLLAELTDHPASLAQAIDQHHERSDGSGYPAHSGAAAHSELGRLLAVVEAVLGTMAVPGSLPMTRAFNALRFVEGEFDQRWTGFFTPRHEHAELAPAERAAPALRVALRESTERLDGAQAAASALAADLAAAPAVRQLANVLVARLDRLRRAWASTGLWGLLEMDPALALAADAELLVQELQHRQRAIARDAAMRVHALSAGERSALDGLLLLLTV